MHDYFYGIVGVSRLPEGKPETVRVKAWYPAAHYIATKPVHPSQRKVKADADPAGQYKVFEGELIPNEELVQQLLVYADQLEIEHPWLREKIRVRALQILEHNQNQ